MITELFKHKAVIICGHFGTGKTNIAVNLALEAANTFPDICIADLDTVNPYFRTADNAESLRARGVNVLLPQFANTNVDIPSLPPAFPLIFTAGCHSVTDVGGNEEGATVLRGFAERYEQIGYDMYYVFNAFRPENVSAEYAVYSLRAIERASGLRFAGIINNSNLGAETDISVTAGAVVRAEAFASAAGVPLVMTTAFEKNAFPGCTVIRDVTKKLF